MKTAAIKFRAKAQTTGYAGKEETWQEVSVPELKRSHCDMPAFRQCEWAHANSDLFVGILRQLRTAVAKHGTLRLDELPKEVPHAIGRHNLILRVSVDTSGFLACVTIECVTV